MKKSTTTKQGAYRCDICGADGKAYYGYTSDYGYCDNPECKREAEARTRSNIMDYIATGDFDLIGSIYSDNDINQLI